MCAELSRNDMKIIQRTVQSCASGTGCLKLRLARWPPCNGLGELNMACQSKDRAELQKHAEPSSRVSFALLISRQVALRALECLLSKMLALIALLSECFAHYRQFQEGMSHLEYSQKPTGPQNSSPWHLSATETPCCSNRRAVVSCQKATHELHSAGKIV